ncbi:MAG: hypothetical protein OXP66_10655 [Candidatus Tectomicrobia bacterium]|nr:hypothetical protein [Candidatus Tectomicrobia bacterium]
MADEYVRTGEFGEFVKRMDERFDHAGELVDQRFNAVDQRFLDLEKRMDQGFEHAEKGREQNFVHLNQRHDDLIRRFDGMQAEIRGLRTMMLALYGPVVVALLGAGGKYLFFS